MNPIKVETNRNLTTTINPWTTEDNIHIVRFTLPNGSYFDVEAFERIAGENMLTIRCCSSMDIVLDCSNSIQLKARPLTTIQKRQ